MDTKLLLNFIIAMLAIVNPVGKVPVWLQVSAGQDEAARNRLALLVTLTAGGVLLASLWAGARLLDLFSIDLACFRIAGGIIVMSVGYGMLNGQATAVDISGEEDGNAMDRAKKRFQSVVVPMAIPIISGPGAITTTIVYASRASTQVDMLALSGVLLAVTTVIFLSLVSAKWVKRVVGEVGLTIVTRVFGLLLMGIAVQLITVGLGEVFPAWLEHTSPIKEDIEKSQAETK
ncbi:MAG: MarC family protein [Myxococcota bacterium]